MAQASSKISQTILNKLKQLQLEKIQYIDQKLNQTRQQYLLKQKNAKNNLVDIDSQQTQPIIPRKFNHPTKIMQIKPWDSHPYQFRYQSVTPTLPTLNQNKKQNRRLSIGQEKQNRQSIPKLKNLLKKLQSPEKINQNNYILDIGDLCKKKKSTMQIIDLLKFQQNWMNPGNNQSKIKPVTSQANLFIDTQQISNNNNLLAPISMNQINLKQRIQLQNKQKQITITLKRNDQFLKNKGQLNHYQSHHQIKAINWSQSKIVNRQNMNRLSVEADNRNQIFNKKSGHRQKLQERITLLKLIS